MDYVKPIALSLPFYLAPGIKVVLIMIAVR